MLQADKKMEEAVGFEPTKIGFAGRRLDHFGIATSGKQHGRQRFRPGLVKPDFFS